MVMHKIYKGEEGGKYRILGWTQIADRKTVGNFLENDFWSCILTLRHVAAALGPLAVLAAALGPESVLT